MIISGQAIASVDDKWQITTLHAKLALVALTGTFIAWHMRRPKCRDLKGEIFLGSLTSIALGVSLAH